jgi:hypothetical protein
MTRFRRTDTVHKECLRAVKLLGLPYRDLSATGGGVGDIIVLMPARVQEVQVANANSGPSLVYPMFITMPAYWLELECKTPMNKKDDKIWMSQYTPAQLKWREQTKDAPRLEVKGFEDCLTKLRERMAA